MEDKTIKERVDIATKTLNDRGLFFPKDGMLVTPADHEIAVPLFIELFGVAPQYEVIGSSIYKLGHKKELFNKDPEGSCSDQDKNISKLLRSQYIGTTYYDYIEGERSYYNPNKISYEVTEKVVNILTEILHKGGDSYVHFANERPGERFILDGGVIIDFLYEGKTSSEVIVYVFAEDRDLAIKIIKNFGYYLR